MNNILSNLGMCRRAGKLVLGFDAVCNLFSKNNSNLVVFLTSDASKKTIKEVKYHANKNDIEVVMLPVTKLDICQILNKPFAVLAVIDMNMANMIKKYL